MEVGSGCEGPGFNPSRCQLYGLGVRHFKVSGGVPSPPEQPPGNRFKNLNGRLAESKRKKERIYIYIYIERERERDIYIYI